MFAAEVIEPGDFIIEYIGELIRVSLSDIRQQQYRAAGADDYLFRVDLE